VTCEYPAARVSGCGMLVAVQFWSEQWRFEAVGLGEVDGWYQGAMPRWWVHFNLLTLRLVGYGMDLHWRRAGASPCKVSGSNSSSNSAAGVVARSAAPASASSSAPSPSVPASTAAAAAAAAAAATATTSKSYAGGAGTLSSLSNSNSPSTSSGGGGRGYFHLVEHPAADVTYSLLEYVAFLFYPPLYLAGPTSSFNAFASQLYAPQTVYTRAAVARYAAVKFAAIVLATAGLACATPVEPTT